MRLKWLMDKLKSQLPTHISRDGQMHDDAARCDQGEDHECQADIAGVELGKL